MLDIVSPIVGKTLKISPKLCAGLMAEEDLVEAVGDVDKLSRGESLS